jgi:hypothetical protein
MLIIKRVEREIQKIAPSFRVGGRRMREGNGNINQPNDGPDIKEIRLNITMGINKVKSSSHKDWVGAPLFKFTNL